MITGRITVNLEPLLDDVFVKNKKGALLPVQIILDTGFNGAIFLPKNVLKQMEVTPIAKEVFELADGSRVEEQTYLGEIIIANEIQTVLLSGMESKVALLGMRMLLEKAAVFDLKNMTIRVIE